MTSSFGDLWDALELWLNTLAAQNATGATLKGYKDNVGRFIQFLQEEQDVHTLGDVQPPHILLWMNYCRERNLEPESLFNYFRVPRTWWNWMLRMEPDTGSHTAAPPKAPCCLSSAVTAASLNR
ncbi:MAG: hypothetical protein KatS3mg022_2953 [Armatimonadota bacterium]|nr:MAG: hypothetical protein KatS3mg022_2953 [Armatimonadota bacterium]